MRRWLALAGAPVVHLLLLLILFYQRIVSPALGSRCRFAPSCSAYAAEALRSYGLWRGLFKTLGRLLRCHPLCRGGYDPP